MVPELALKIGDAIIDRFKITDSYSKNAFKAYFKHVFTDPLITPDGIYIGEHGMPSGTTFTNELDSCYNEVLCHAFKYLPSNATMGKRCELKPVTTQGDDLVLILTSSSKLSEKEVKEILASGYDAMNMEVNPQKQMISKYKCDYLKRLHIKGITESYRSYT